MFQSNSNLNQKEPVFVSASASNKKLNVSTFAGSMVSIGNFNQTLNVATLEEEFQDQPFWQRFYEISVQIVKDIIDVKLLFQNFQLFCLVMCNFFGFAALFVPYIYIPVYCKTNNLTPTEISTILSAIGIVNIPYRLLFGAVADRRWISSVNLNTIAIAVASVGCVMIAHLTTFWGTIISGCVFAFGTGKESFDTNFRKINLYYSQPHKKIIFQRFFLNS